MMRQLRQFLAKLATTLDIDPRGLKNVTKINEFFRARRTWLASGGRIDEYLPILGESRSAAGQARGHYFHMDLFVASKIAQQSPQRHVDIGSRIDGFIAHVASFRTVDVLDIRPAQIDGHPQIKFILGDLMDIDVEAIGQTDSLSCLHVIEHIGLGRYGDSIDPNGHLLAADNLLKLLKPNGRLYLACPIGKPRTVFNAHRVFQGDFWPRVLGDRLDLLDFSFIDDNGDLHINAHPEHTFDLSYGCGIYTFKN
jgi:hypothetical protein